jgi:hypothetical protein
LHHQSTHWAGVPKTQIDSSSQNKFQFIKRGRNLPQRGSTPLLPGQPWPNTFPGAGNDIDLTGNCDGLAVAFYYANQNDYNPQERSRPVVRRRRSELPRIKFGDDDDRGSTRNGYGGPTR